MGLAASAPKPKPPPNVLIVSDVFSDVPDTLRPQPGKPVYYYLLGKVETDIGTPARGEPRADPAAVEAEVVKVLASQGFVRTQLGGPMPSIVIIVTFGSANLDTMEIQNTNPLPTVEIGNPQPGEEPPPPPPESFLTQFNRREMMALIGADKANRTMLDASQIAQINDAAASTRGYIVIAALDADALGRKKEKKLLWRTRMSIETLRNSLPESLGVMLASAAPLLGREAPLPVLITEADRRKASVEVGTPYVVPDGKTAPAQKAKK